MKRTSNTSAAKTASRRTWLWVTFLLFAGITLIGLYIVFAPNTGAFKEGDNFYIRTGSGYNQVKESLLAGGFVNNEHTFDLLAKQAGYPDKVKAGKYKLHKGMSNYTIIRTLGSGRQESVKIVINKLRTKAAFISLIGKQLEADSVALKGLLNDPDFLRSYGLDSSTVLCAVLPATYEFYWNTNAKQAFEKIANSYTIFWTEKRKTQAFGLKLDPVKATILASIVQEEYYQKSERGTIASVYLNRLSKGMKLQADPTAKFAYGDFSLKRITSKQTTMPSPYNTYYVSGLPVGPICTPEQSTIDAVLTAPATNYLFFSAKPDRSGFHNFADSYSEHLKNAASYHQSLNERNIH